jgi:hypothetical protein
MDRTKPQLALLVLLLVFYCLGPTLALVAATGSIGRGGSIENVFLRKLLTALATDPGAYTGILNQMIVPVVAAITAADHKHILASKWSAWLFLIPLVTIFVCIGGALFFNVVNIAGEVAAGMTAAPSGAIAQLYLNWAGTLSVYVMLLVGLSAGTRAETATIVKTGTDAGPEVGSTKR